MRITHHHSKHIVDLDVHWKEFEPYISMVEDGEVSEQAMIDAATAIVRTIEMEAASERSFRASYKRIKMIQCADLHARLGFADSEASSLIDHICREIWGREAESFIGEGW